jgi:hypothetical protein
MAVTTQNLASNAVRGVQWTAAATVLTAVMQIGYPAVMARVPVLSFDTFDQPLAP